MLDSRKLSPVLSNNRDRRLYQLARHPNARALYAGVGEPPLAELLADPILSRLLTSDRISMAELVQLIGETKARLSNP
jgi:hypothetical protein